MYLAGCFYHFVFALMCIYPKKTIYVDASHDLHILPYIDVYIVNIMHIYIYNSSKIRKLKSIQFNVIGETGGAKGKTKKKRRLHCIRLL